MAGETIITVVGNLTADPELRYTQNGLPVANFSIASTPRTFDKTTNEWKDGEALFLRCSVWREFAEHVAASLTKGMRVVAQGRLTQRNYQDKDNNQRSAIELEIDEIGPSLKYATAQVTRVPQGGSGGQQAPQQQGGYAPQQQGGYAPQQQQGGYAPQQQAPQQQQGYAPQQQAPAQQPQQQAPQPQAQPQQAAPQQQQAPQQQAQPQQGAYQQPGQQWAQPGAFSGETPF